MVFVIARPLRKRLARFSPACRYFKFCHWAVLICENNHSVEDLRTWISKLNSGMAIQPEVELGYLFELFRIPETATTSGLNCMTPFTTGNLLELFPDCSIAYVGTTDLEQKEVESQGSSFGSGSRYR